VLVLPAFSFVEPESTLQRRGLHRRELQQALERELRELHRMTGFSEEQREACGVAFAALVAITQRSEERFRHFRERLLRAAEVLPLTADVISRSSQYRQRLDMSAPDSLVLASVMSDPKIGQAEACFLNRNARDFDDVSVREELATMNCKLISTFAGGLSYIQRAVASGS
jgi:hypothetical protein